MVMQNPSKFENICMEPILVMGQLIRGIVGVLCSFEHKQYSSSNVSPWCLITKYPTNGIVFFGDFGRATQYHSTC